MQNLKPPSLLLIGRTNVGKSTLFNRLVGKKKALALSAPGVTRDFLIGYCDGDRWNIDQLWEVIDSAGIWEESPFGEAFYQRLLTKIHSVTWILFLLDGKSEITEIDRFLWSWLRKQLGEESSKVIGMVNKIDHPVHDGKKNLFFELGFSKLFAVSAEHNRGLETVLYYLSDEEKKKKKTVKEKKIKNKTLKLEEEEKKSRKVLEEVQEFKIEIPNQNRISEKNQFQKNTKPTRIVLVGRPNVGKSTLFNALFQKEIVFTSPIAGTTTDPIGNRLTLEKHTKENTSDWQLFDLPGIKARAKTKPGVEKLCFLKAQNVLKKASIALMLFDAKEGPTDQEKRLSSWAWKWGASLVFLINKWDEMEGVYSFQDAKEKIQETFSFLPKIPILKISALYQKDFSELKRILQRMKRVRQYQVSTSELTRWSINAFDMYGQMGIKCFYAHQVRTGPPEFLFHVKQARCTLAFQRYLERAIQKQWGFLGTPVRVRFTK